VNLASGALPTLLESSGTPAHPGTGFGVSDDPMTLSGPGGELAQPKECVDNPILVTHEPPKVTPKKSEIARNGAAARPAVAGYGVTPKPAKVTQKSEIANGATARPAVAGYGVTQAAAAPVPSSQNEGPPEEESRDQSSPTPHPLSPVSTSSTPS
ncbi:MAG TPA: hypothetical protein VKY85_05290, partial [Candidatus Angelobacter sp.]|nr:hypothetical protein [Candidatus Angelobacter sp.]